MIHPTPTKVLLTTTFASLVMQLSGSLARGTRLIDTPPEMSEFAPPICGAPIGAVEQQRLEPAIELLNRARWFALVRS